MSRFSFFVRAAMATTLISAASSGAARADRDRDEALARKLATAASAFFDHEDATARYRETAEIAQEILLRRQHKTNLIAQIRDANSQMAVFPQNRLLWLAEQWQVLHQKLAWDNIVTAIDKEIEDLNLRQQWIYERELARARENGKAVKPIHREAILGELDRLDRQRQTALTELRDGIDEAARDERTNRVNVWERICAVRDEITPKPQVPAESLQRFIKAFRRELSSGRSSSPNRNKGTRTPNPRKPPQRTTHRPSMRRERPDNVFE